MVERSINGSANESSVTFDAAGRITNITNLLGNFDLAYVGVTGRLATVTAPNGLVTTFDYFGNSQDRRLKTLTYTGPSSTAISEFEYAYEVTGQITQWTQSQVANTSHPELLWDVEQDAADQLTGVTIRDGGTVVKREANVYDKAGNRLSAQINNAVKGGTFNNLNQLTALAGGGKLRFVGTTDEPADVKVQGQNALMHSATNFSAYAEVSEGTNNIPIVATDGNGNSRTNTYQVVVPSGTSRSFTYDFNGNLLDDGEREYEMDAENRVIRITQGGNEYEFAYDGAGRKISETVNSTLTRQWVWDGLGMAEERDASNAVTKRFFGQGEQVVGASSPNDKLYYTRDHLGSIREVTDSTGAVVSAFSYSSWGKQTTITGSIVPSFGYTGHWVHGATGLISAPFRFYDPETGRWQSRDPIGEAGGLNLYGYVSNNPINLWDPLGLAWTDAMPMWALDAISSVHIPQGVVDFSAGFGDTLSFNITSGIRDLTGANSVVCKDSGFYTAGEVAGTGVGLAMGGGGLLKGGAQGIKTLFYDGRKFSSISKSFWKSQGGANGQALHHWLIPQSARWVPQGIRNAGWNIVPISGRTNTYMGFAQNWGGASPYIAAAMENGMRVSIIGSLGAPVTALLND